MPPSLAHEKALWAMGARTVAGIDEVGRGALAGPVSVGVCVLGPTEIWPYGLDDSKKLSPAERVALVGQLIRFGLGRAVGHASAKEIDQIGIVGALSLAARRGLAQIAAAGIEPDRILLDGTHDWLSPAPATLFDAEEAPAPLAPVTVVKKGDAECVSIAAASVLAKVDRDAIMVALSDRHPEYGWDSNKGYGSAAHLEAIEQHGTTDEHRRSWKLPASSAGAAASVE